MSQFWASQTCPICLLLGEAGVHHINDAVDGDGGLRNVGGHNHLPSRGCPRKPGPWRGLKDLLLLLWRQGGVERHSHLVLDGVGLSIEAAKQKRISLRQTTRRAEGPALRSPGSVNSPSATALRFCGFHDQMGDLKENHQNFQYVQCTTVFPVSGHSKCPLFSNFLDAFLPSSCRLVQSPLRQWETTGCPLQARSCESCVAADPVVNI